MESCARCGAENEAGRAACWNCLGPLESTAAAAAAPEDVEVVRTPRFALRIPWKPIVAVIVLAGLVFGGLKFVKGRSPASVAGSYLDAVIVGDTERQGRLTTGGTGALALLEKQFKLKEFQLQPGSTVGGGGAEVMAALTIEPDTTSITAEGAADLVAAMRSLKQPVTATISLTREGRAWKVDQDATARRLRTQLEKKLTPELIEKLGQVRVPPVPGPTAGGMAAPGTGVAPSPGARAPTARLPIIPPPAPPSEDDDEE